MPDISISALAASSALNLLVDSCVGGDSSSGQLAEADRPCAVAQPAPLKRDQTESERSGHFALKTPHKMARREHTPAAGFPQLLPAEADGILVRGEKSRAIKRLHLALGLVADGDFGHATERVVIAFPKARGLAADGAAGPQTLAALGITLKAA